MKKRQVIFIVLLGLTLIYPLIFYYSAQAHNAACAAELDQYPVEIRPYIDPPPFSGTLNGSLIMLFGAVIAVSWFILFLWRK